ncbi:hypothetical protein [Cellulophaga baltica]|uniref:Uncharacterized protein n=1 Tax=Cellulophaga baltica 18 TaxID=1348584 RepID=A0AAU8RBI8_9FLAO|nr:hypothetical protein [Cellulophaga baltica]AIZ41217.1 hypothetical protein M666_06310 [Cellulophaga baltica 18]
MKGFKLSIMLMFFLTGSTIAQGLIYEGNKSYNTSDTWEFMDNCEKGFAKVKITLGRYKNDTSGILLMEIWKPFKMRFSDELTIYLENGEIIRIYSNGNRDYVDDSNMGTYTLTAKNIEELRLTKIKTIRYSYTGEFNKTCTASNEKLISFIETEKDYDTIKSIKNLW